MEEILNNIEQYILVIGPALVSIITMIASVITSIKKCAQVAKDGLAETKAIKTSVANCITNMSLVTTENAEIKATLNSTLETLAQELKTLAAENETLKAEKENIQELKAELEELKNTNKTLEAQIKHISGELEA